MGYACPVCGDPQADAEHLANHLAFTAMLRGADHEAWLDEHVDDWADLAPEELAERVTEHADEEEFPQVFEDTTGGHDHDHGHGHGDHGGQPGSAGNSIADAAPGGVADLDDFEGEQEDVLAEARELTRQRRTNSGDEDGDSEGDEAGDGTDATDDSDDEETGSS
ncbi:DUF5810 domain-containing protein [Halosimplex sp. J119]